MDWHAMATATLERRPAAPRPTARGPIGEQILPQLRQDIVTGRWKPGDRLPEPELCEAFGVSRTPLRDALKILETEGLVRLLPHVGATVTPLDPPDLSDKLEVMTGLEQVAASGVAIRQDPAVVRRIHGLHQSMMDAARQNQVHRYYGLNDEFHAAIVRSNRNDTLSRLHETMMWHVFRARRRVNEAVPLAPDAARHHEGIVSAIFAADPDAASLAMRHHLGEVARSVLAGLDGLDSRPLPLHVI
jgi:DNA-binding GntR family transcriptional regulator